MKFAQKIFLNIIIKHWVTVNEKSSVNLQFKKKVSKKIVTTYNTKISSQD